MAEAKLANVLPDLPVGTLVSAFPGVLVDAGVQKPIAPVLDTAVVDASGGLWFLDLPEAGREYVAASEVEGRWVFIRFSTRAPSGGGGGASQEELEALQEQVALLQGEVEGKLDIADAVEVVRLESEEGQPEERPDVACVIWICDFTPAAMDPDKDIRLNTSP